MENRDAFSAGCLEGKVLNFFLDIFINQSGILEDEEVDAAYHCLDPDRPGPEHTYEFRIKGKKNRLRRMALRPLGEKSGSKSICFKVIYSDLLVVKIPPVPVNDFDEYIRQIDKERRIAGMLTPAVATIAPSISAILKRLPRFAPKPHQSDAGTEQGYISLLKKKSWLQDHLKIDGVFSFFMNLSQFSFLSQMIEQMHDIKSRVHEETFGQFDILWNLMAFEEMFGPRNGPVFFDINEIYAEYEDAVNELLSKSGVHSHTFMFKRKEWFLLFLAQKNEISNDEGLPETFNRNLQSLFLSIEKGHREKITAYRQMMHNYVSEKMFLQNRSQFKTIALNMLELLFRLRKQSVVIRDLKPDNIFVMCNSFIDKTDQFLLGLIDFETAVCIEPKKKVEQPPLAGTPSYATPSHMVSNEVIQNTLDNVVRVLHLQDWHAVVCMMFGAVTGEGLFTRSRVWVSETWNIMQKARKMKVTPEAAFIQCSRLFWQSALKEFHKKLNRYEKTLKNITIELPEKITAMLKKEQLADKTRSTMKCRQLVCNQPFFKGKKSHNDLLQSSHSVVQKCRLNWEKGVNIPEVSPEIQSRIILFFKSLEQHKDDIQTRNRMLRKFSTPSVSMKLFDILILMFQIVSNAMYQKEWDELPDAVVLPDSRHQKHPDDHSYEETVAYEETLAYDGQPKEHQETEIYEKTLSFDDINS